MTRSLHALLAAWGDAVAGTSHPQPPPYAGPDATIARLVEDSRQVQPGDGFVARRRRRHDGAIYSDGHPFVAAAVAAGATFILAEEPAPPELPAGVAYLSVRDSAVALAWLAAAWHGFPAQQLVIVGITGTDGKTTTANLLYGILRGVGWRAGLISTINAYIGDRVLDTGLHVSTPEAPDVQRYLRQMVDAGLTHAVLECTSHGLAQHRVGAVAFDVAVVTNVTHEHLDYHGSWEGYLAAKGRLVEALAAAPLNLPAAPAKVAQPRVAVLNAEDPGAMRLRPATSPPFTVRFGLEAPAEVRAEGIDATPDGTRFRLVLDTRSARLHTSQAQHAAPPRLLVASPLVGGFNVANMLAAAATADVLGVAEPDIAAGLAATTGVSGRMERIDRGQPYPVMVDFAHTPNALAQALAAARAMASGRVIAVFGSAGKRDVEKRRLMAEIGARDADLVVLTAEDPRTESLDEILEQMAAGCRAQGGVEGEDFWRVPDRGRAIYFALELARSPADIVVICGKGHEQSMCFDATEYPWDDRPATRAALDAFLAGEPAPDLGLPTYESTDL